MSTVKKNSRGKGLQWMLWLIAFLFIPVYMMAQPDPAGPGGPGDPTGPGRPIPDPFEKAMFSNGGVMEACPKDPIAFELTGIHRDEALNYVYQWFTSVNNIDWKNEGALTISSNTFQMPNSEFWVKVVATAYEGNKELYKHEYTSHIPLRQDCKTKECHQTSTGEYYGGTDFTYDNEAHQVDWGHRNKDHSDDDVPPTGFEEYFSEQEIVFSCDPGSIVTQDDLGVKFALESDSSKNNFYFKDGHINGTFFSVLFPVAKYKNSTYRFTMRFYIILPNGCSAGSFQEGAAMRARTGHGMVTTDSMDCRIIAENGPNAGVLSEVTVGMQNDAAKIQIANVIKYSSASIFRLEMTYYGTFPNTTNSLKYYIFYPEFAQFPDCAQIAIDYISAEVPSVCLDPLACVGEAITVNAAGFPRKTDYTWTKYTDGSYTQVEPWIINKDTVEIEYEYDALGQKERAYITMLDKGVFYYSLSVGGESIRFALGGKICGSAMGPGIEGDSNACIVNFPHRQTYKIKNDSILHWIIENGDRYGYKWWLESPDGAEPDETKVRLEMAKDSMSADLIVEKDARKSDYYNPDQQYMIYVTSHIYDKTGKLSDKYESKDSFAVWIYDQPNISNLNFVTHRGEDTMCVATSSDTIILEGKDDVKGYTWNFTGAEMGADSVIRIVNFDKGSLCNIADTTFRIGLEVVNGTCRASMADTFHIHSTAAPTINCDKLSGLSYYELAEGRLDTTIHLPLPEYSTSCDDDPALNVTIHYTADDTIHSFDSIFTLHKEQTQDSLKRALTLFSGKGTVSYVLVDGCGKSASCEIELTVKDTTNPAVDCNLVRDYNVAVTTDDGCVARPGENINIEIPYLRDTTFKDTVIMIKAEYAGRSEKDLSEDPGVDTTKYSMDKKLEDDYELGTTFILWRFADPAGNAMYCHSRVTVKNDTLMFLCDSIDTPLRTKVNENPNRVYYYASAQAQSTVNPDTKYSLADLLTIPTYNKKYCGNVKLDIHFTGDCVDENGELDTKAVDSLISDVDLLKHRFPIGHTVVKYTFSSDYLDFDSQKYDTIICLQDIIITSGNPPLPDSCPNDKKLAVDPNNCLAASPFTTDDVPHATVSYFCETKYTYDECSGGSYNYDDLGLSSALSKDYDTTVYPVRVRRLLFLDDQYNRTDSTVVYDCESIITSLDSVPIKKVQHRMGADKSVCAEDPIEMMALKLTNFTTLPSCVTDSFARGYHLLVWYFDNGKGDMDSCVTHINVVDSTPPILDTVCKDPEKDLAAYTMCELPYDSLSLPELSLNDVCDGLLLPAITAYVSQKDGSVKIYHDEELKTALYPTGQHKVVWVFTDKAGLQDSCSMIINIIDSLALKVDSCDIDKDVIVTLEPGLCSLDPHELSNYMTFPSAYDLCDDDTLIPRIERRFNGELVVDDNGNPIVWDSQNFPLGKTDIRWIWVDKVGIMKDSCEKSVTVKTELFPCSTLLDTVRVDLLEKFYATAQEVVAAGLKTPSITIDTCQAATLSFFREDSLDFDANYKIGNTNVEWKFKYVFGDSVVCPQVVKIQDMVPPTLDCPIETKYDYECYGEIPAPYPTFEDLLAAGATFSDMRKYKEGSYEWYEESEGSLPCEYKLHRTYQVLDVRGNKVTCTQDYTIKDVTAPVIHTKLDTTFISCEQDSLIEIALGMEDIQIVATDNCTPDSALVIHKKVRTNRSDDVHSCTYNTYTIWRTWTVEDSCGHISDSLVQVVQVVDTIAPTFKLADGWRDTVLATNMKHCTQAVPSLEDKARNFIQDLCTDINDINVWQVPAGGTVVEKDLIVWIYAEDKCGNKDSLFVYVVVQNPRNVVEGIGYNQDICGSETTYVDLQSQKVRYAQGDIKYEEEDGSIEKAKSTFAYDYYRGWISESTLIYSDNAATYHSRFYNEDEGKLNETIRERTRLNRLDQSDLYVFVIMDTTTQCTDTVSAYINIRERPRILMNSDNLEMCEDDTLDIIDIYNNTLPCVDSMGAVITKTGWVLEGVDYVAGTPIPYSDTSKVLYYFVENMCGRTTSYDSKYTTCGFNFYTKEDSLAHLGYNTEKYELWKKDQLYKRDSFLLNVHKRYESANLSLATSPLGINRCWIGDEVTLSLTTTYSPSIYVWYRTHSKIDVVPNVFDKYGTVLNPEADELLEPIYLDIDRLSPDFTFMPIDTARYYVVVGDGVCPTVPSNIVKINVLEHVPTAFTPTRADGLNDIFLEGRYVVVYNRYGDKVSESTNGWDGKDHSGRFADAGVYFYLAEINGNTFKGTIELIHLDIK